MAKTNKNKIPPLIWWLLGGISILGIVFMLLPQEDHHMKLRGKIRITKNIERKINAYVRWSGAGGRNQQVKDHQYAAQGLTKLVAALESLSDAASEDIRKDAEPKVKTIEELTASLETEADSLTHAATLKEAFINAGEVLTAIQLSSFPRLRGKMDTCNMQISQLRTETALSAQKNSINEVFQHISGVLYAMEQAGNQG